MDQDTRTKTIIENFHAARPAVAFLAGIADEPDNVTRARFNSDSSSHPLGEWQRVWVNQPTGAIVRYESACRDIEACLAIRQAELDDAQRSMGSLREGLRARQPLPGTLEMATFAAQCQEAESRRDMLAAEVEHLKSSVALAEGRDLIPPARQGLRRLLAIVSPAMAQRRVNSLKDTVDSVIRGIREVVSVARDHDAWVKSIELAAAGPGESTVIALPEGWEALGNNGQVPCLAPKGEVDDPKALRRWWNR